MTPGTGRYLLNRVDFPPSAGFGLSFCALLTVHGLNFIWVVDSSRCKQICGAFLENKQLGFLRCGMCITWIGPNKQKLTTCSQSHGWDL